MRRTTEALRKVATVLVADPAARHWGYDLSKRAGVRSGVVYPMLSRLLDDGWLVDGWEDPATIGGRPPRRYYQLTELGRARLGELLTT